jgi:hypothetical protein
MARPGAGARRPGSLALTRAWRPALLPWLPEMAAKRRKSTALTAIASRTRAGSGWACARVSATRVPDLSRAKRLG